jgi:membrane protein required for colicin V production
MVLDIIGVSLVIIFFIRGYMKGFIVAIFSLLSIILGIICALKLSEKFAAFLAERNIITSGWVQIVSFIVLLIGVALLVRLIAKIIDTAIKAAFLGWLNGILGGVFYGFMMAVIWSCFLWLFTQAHLLKPETTANSRTYLFFSKLAPWVCEKTGVIWPMAKEVITDTEHFFEGVDKKLPGHVDTAR